MPASVQATISDSSVSETPSTYDRYYGDPSNKPNPNLGEIKHGPFYAAKMVPDDLGTKGPGADVVHTGGSGRDGGTRAAAASSRHSPK